MKLNPSIHPISSKDNTPCSVPKDEDKRLKTINSNKDKELLSTHAICVRCQGYESLNWTYSGTPFTNQGKKKR